MQSCRRFMLSVYVKFTALFVLGLVILTLHYPVSERKIPITNQNEETAELQRRFQRIRDCLIGMIHTKHPAWSILHLIINTCSLQEFKSFDFFKFHTDKLFLHFHEPEMKDHECVAVTLGIGNDTMMEYDIKHRYPHCQFYGADPTPSVSEGFTKYGKYFPLAIDATTGTQHLSIMSEDGKYRPVTLRTKALYDFLSEDVKKSLIHFMSIDVEGSEYRLLPYLSDHVGHDISPPGTSSSKDVVQRVPSICQMTMELHGPLKDYGYSYKEFEKIFLDFVARSPFVPLRAFTPGNHHRFFAFNAFDPKCIELFSFAKDQTNEKGLMRHDKVPGSKHYAVVKVAKPAVYPA